MGPVSEDEYASFSEMNSQFQNGEFSSCIGWVIRQGETLLTEEDHVVNMKKELDILVGTPRLLQGWAITLHFTYKVW